MRGKVGIVVGLAAGYVLGARAGRGRYEQIKKQWLKLWDSSPVLTQRARVKDAVGDVAASAPKALWSGVVKLAVAVDPARRNGGATVTEASAEKPAAGDTAAGGGDETAKRDGAGE